MMSGFVKRPLIRVDSQVFQVLESRRAAPAQTHNDVLREMIGLPALDETEPDTTAEQSDGWSSKGVELPNGTKLRMSYNGQLYAGMIVQGAWHTGGAIYRSPSGAAAGVARSRRGTRVDLDGWHYWEAQKPGSSSWVRINRLRK
jgi:hypothetical protein